MIDLMYESPSPKPSPSITLECMWKVQTDKSYHGVRGSLHKNNCIAILTVGGIGNVGFPFGNVELLPGTLIVFPYHDMNYYRPQKEDWRFYWFEFDCIPKEIPCKECISVEVNERHISLIEEICRLLPISSKAPSLSAVFMGLLMEWTMGVKSADSENEETVRRTIEYIEFKLSTRPSVSELAKELRISERTLSELFKKETGMTVREYLSELRIKNAKRLLNTTKISVKELAFSLGFENQYYFSNFFKRKTGVSPTEYRKSSRDCETEIDTSQF